MTAGDMSSDEARIDVSVVSALVAAQFPEWAELPVAPVGKPGVDNATYRLGDEMSVRLPRFERWVGQVFREHEWLPVLAPQLPLAVSVPLAQGEPGEGYPFPWSIYKWLDGDAAGPEALTDPEESARELAAFVAAFQRGDRLRHDRGRRSRLRPDRSLELVPDTAGPRHLPCGTESRRRNLDPRPRLGPGLDPAGTR